MASRKNNKVVEKLSVLLADTYVLTLKTQNYHWNVTGPNFIGLHKLLEEHYNDLFEANDVIAERIRALGEKAPGSFAVFSKLSSVKEETGNPSSDKILKNLAADHQTLAESCEAVINEADEVDDEVSEDLAINRLKFHQKAAWMLKAHLD
jgi:starvation-inducible DNA-binding protein